jgi:hypothetical protein
MAKFAASTIFACAAIRDKRFAELRAAHSEEKRSFGSRCSLRMAMLAASPDPDFVAIWERAYRLF